MMLILASASKIRSDLLYGAGVDIKIEPAHIDENHIKISSLKDGISPNELAMKLAGLKAEKISKLYKSDLVLGVDQLLICDDQLFSKPRTLEDAKIHLQNLRGKVHQLICGTVIYHNGQEVWRSLNTASLLMRNFSDNFIDEYLLNAPNDALDSVGSYHLEGLGAQMFSKIKGDYFTILGLPLLDILAYLRDRQILRD